MPAWLSRPNDSLQRSCCPFAELQSRWLNARWGCRGRTAQADARARSGRRLLDCLLAREIDGPPPLPAAQPPAAPALAAPSTAEPASGEIGISDKVSEPKPRKRAESLPRQRTKAILRDLYPDGLPSNDEVSEADLVTTVERQWDIKPNPKLVRMPSPWTIKRVIAKLRAPPSPPR